jgi:hypothetical protein
VILLGEGENNAIKTSIGTNGKMLMTNMETWAALRVFAGKVPYCDSGFDEHTKK